MTTEDKVDAVAIGIEKTKYAEEWSGSYRGISWSIRKWASLGRLEIKETRWNFYIYIAEGQEQEGTTDDIFLPFRTEEECKDSLLKPWVHDYYNCPLAQLPWHGDITYYQYERETLGHRVIKVGCDYSHLFDEGMEYDMHGIRHEVFAVIDALYEMYPNLKERCFWNGKYYERKDMTMTEKGNWISEEGREARTRSGFGS